MEILIFANGRLNLQDAMSIPEKAFVIAADGGTEHCLSLGFFPDLIIGDLDSLHPEIIREVKEKGCRIQKFPKRKDETDLELALDHALKMEPDTIRIFGALGGRWDMSFANLLLLVSVEESAVDIRMIDGRQEIVPVFSGREARISGEKGDRVSFLPIQGDAKGITLHGFEYPLEKETLCFGKTRGVSNRLMEREGIVFVESGKLLCFHSRKRQNRIRVSSRKKADDHPI